MRGISTAAIVATLLVAGPAYAHQGNPNMESVVRTVTPETRGLSLAVLNRDDRFELVNHSDADVVIEGYSGEPYARIGADGEVAVNTRSPAFYLNDDRYANVTVPSDATATARPVWKELDRSGRFQWHDHRMHYMGKGVPPAVKDSSKRQKVFDYTIPLRIGGSKGAIEGTLLWTPQAGGGPPAGAIAGLAILAAVGGAAVVAIRRRRKRSGTEQAGEEAW
jgi:hypothetical protein